MNHTPTIETFLYTSSQWAKKKYAAQIARIRQNAQKPKDVSEKMIDGHIMTELLFKWVNPDTGITPAEEFARSIDDKYDWVDAVNHMIQLFYGGFRVLEMLNETSGIVESIDTAKRYKVTFRAGRGDMYEGDVFACYIHPWYDDTYCTIGTFIRLGKIPPGIITPGMGKMLSQLIMGTRQERHNVVPITAQTDIATYLKSQSADHVTKVAESLDIYDGTKEEKIQRVYSALGGAGIIRAINSLPASHKKCLEMVAAAGLIKRHALKRKIDGGSDTITELHQRGLLMLGVKTAGGKQREVVAIPADVLYNAVMLTLLIPGGRPPR